jgi:hypothetical protein
MFAALVLERDPIRWHDLARLFHEWVLNAGGLAAAACVLFWLYSWINPSIRRQHGGPAWRSGLLWMAILAMVAGYVGYGVLYSPIILSAISSVVETEGGQAEPLGSPGLRQILLFVGAIGALVTILLPFVLDLFKLRARRIWAIARLSFKEAIRRRVLWIFSALLLLMLFASWFIDSEAQHDQLRSYVQVIFTAMTLLLLATAALLASFSIPADIRNNSIHTIVTKPVERFEIVLGRFLGFTGLMTIVLAFMTGISLLYVFREIDTESKQESMRARVPVFGQLAFLPERLNVGREWDYRGYISGGAQSPQRAIYSFAVEDLPADLAEDTRGPTVPCEFTFDIFRTLKGEEGKGVLCSFFFVTRNWDAQRQADYERDREAERRKPGATAESVDAALAERYGLYQIPSKVVVDYHTQQIDVPTAIFRNALSGDKPGMAVAAGSPAALQVRIKCESGGQYLGFAKYDFYVLAKERSFAWNFFKGAMGLWLRLCIVVGLAVASSTYLSGVVALLTTGFIYVAGFAQDYVRSLAENQLVGGGPLESFVRLVTTKGAPTVQLESTPTADLAKGTDVAYRWILRLFMQVIPDVDRFDWTNYVAEGFNIATWEVAILNLVLVAGYLLPWAVLSYYLIKTREIATY